MLCLLALDGATVGEAARTLRVLPRTVRAEARDALAAARQGRCPGSTLRDGRADGPGVRWLLSSAVEDLPAPGPRGVGGAPGGSGAGVGASAQPARRRWRRRRPAPRRRSWRGGRVGRRSAEEAPPGSPVLRSTSLDGVTVMLAPTPCEEATLPLAPGRGALGVPDPVGPGEPGAVEPLPSGRCRRSRPRGLPRAPRPRRAHPGRADGGPGRRARCGGRSRRGSTPARTPPATSSRPAASALTGAVSCCRRPALSSSARCRAARPGRSGSATSRCAWRGGRPATTWSSRGAGTTPGSSTRGPAAWSRWTSRSTPDATSCSGTAPARGCAPTATTAR